MEYAQTTMWQCDKSLIQCLGYVLEMGIAFDVEFMCGKAKKKVKAHSFILKHRSPVFGAMLGEEWSDLQPIVVEDIEDTTFFEFLRYLYTDETSISTENVVELRYAARKYCVDLLAERCLQFVYSNINSENACIFLERANMCMDEEIFSRSLSEIEHNTLPCIQSKSFLSLSSHCMQSITESDELNVDEFFLLDRILKWYFFKCSSTDSPIANLHEVINNIRFPLIDFKRLQGLVKMVGHLDEKEKCRILSFSEIMKNKFPISNLTKRRRGPTRIVRFSSHSEKEDPGTNNGPISVSFSLNEEAYLHGIILYRAKYDEDDSFNVVLRTASGDVICCDDNITFTTSTCEGMTDILLPSCVLLTAQTKYKLSVNATKGSHFKGIGRIEEMDFSDNKKVHFHETTIMHNGLETYCEHGQIPGLILS